MLGCDRSSLVADGSELGGEAGDALVKLGQQPLSPLLPGSGADELSLRLGEPAAERTEVEASVGEHRDAGIGESDRRHHPLHVLRIEMTAWRWSRDQALPDA